MVMPMINSHEYANTRAKQCVMCGVFYHRRMPTQSLGLTYIH